MDKICKIREGREKMGCNPTFSAFIDKVNSIRIKYAIRGPWDKKRFAADICQNIPRCLKVSHTFSLANKMSQGRKYTLFSLVWRTGHRAGLDNLFLVTQIGISSSPGKREKSCFGTLKSNSIQSLDYIFFYYRSYIFKLIPNAKKCKYFCFQRKWSDKNYYFAKIVMPKWRIQDMVHQRTSWSAWPIYTSPLLSRSLVSPRELKVEYSIGIQHCRNLPENVENSQDIENRR